MKNLVLLASGSGSNVENIISHFKNNPAINVSCVLTNKSNAGVLDRCNRLSIPAFYFNKHAFATGEVLNYLKSVNPDLIILAGFLKKIPKAWINVFPNKIINIHPALLPKYGGKGMYGEYVHRAVKNSQDVETGITIHHVNENYDEGNIIFQARTKVSPEDTVAQIAQKVHKLEYEHYPQVIENLLKDE
jgi:phosphoribosylglycinamide formyltransferase-1